MSDSLWPHGLQHTRLPCPSPIPGTCSNSCPSSRWCHPPISSFVVPFSFCLQSFPASGSFQRSQFFASDGQSTGASPSALVFQMNIQGWPPSGWLVWSPCYPRGYDFFNFNYKEKIHKIFTLDLFLLLYHFLYNAHSKNILGGYFEKKQTHLSHIIRDFSRLI